MSETPSGEPGRTTGGEPGRTTGGEPSRTTGGEPSRTTGGEPSRTIAVIATGGKQYLVRSGDRIKVETLAGEPNAPITFGEVLLVAQGDDVKVGTPRVAGASVTGTILAHGRHDKVVGVKFKPKKRYRKKFGHRQHYTEVRIDAIRNEKLAE